MREGWCYGEARLSGADGTRLPTLWLGPGVTTVTAEVGRFLPCFFKPEVGWGDLEDRIKKHLLDQNPSMEADLLLVRMMSASHVNTASILDGSSRPDSLIIFVTPSSCTLGPPV